MHEIDLIHVLYPRMFALADLNVVTLALLGNHWVNSCRSGLDGCRSPACETCNANALAGAHSVSPAGTAAAVAEAAATVHCRKLSALPAAVCSSNATHQGLEHAPCEAYMACYACLCDR